MNLEWNSWFRRKSSIVVFVNIVLLFLFIFFLFYFRRNFNFCGVEFSIRLIHSQEGKLIVELKEIPSVIKEFFYKWLKINGKALWIIYAILYLCQFSQTIPNPVCAGYFLFCFLNISLLLLFSQVYEYEEIQKSSKLKKDSFSSFHYMNNLFKLVAK